MLTNYNELIGYDSDGNAVILLYTFHYSDGFKGATGAILELVSPEVYDERTSDEALRDYAEELWRADAAQPNGTTLGLSDWAEMARDDLIQGVFDDSYSDLVPEGEHVATNCVGVGRIFPNALDNIVTWVRPDLADVITRRRSETRPSRPGWECRHCGAVQGRSSRSVQLD